MRLIAIAAAVTCLSAMPASAQIWGGTRMSSPVAPADRGFGPELSGIGSSIHDGRRSGQLSRSEARNLKRMRAYIGDLEARFARDGLSEAERNEIATRLYLLRDRVLAERSN